MDAIQTQLSRVASLRDKQIQQSLHYPTVQVTVDRERAGLSGVTARDVGESLIAATYSSRYTSRNFWRDDANGNSYQVQVQVPTREMSAATDVELVPITPSVRKSTQEIDSPNNPTPPLLVGDVAGVMRNEMPGEIDRYNMRRYLSLTANIEGEDLGRTIDRLDRAIAAAGKPPKGVEVELRGQVKPMKDMFLSLEIGLAVAGGGHSDHPDSLFSGAEACSVRRLGGPRGFERRGRWACVTRTTLNIESFMGAIMAVGVAVSNAIMLVTFADRHRREEKMRSDQAAVTAAKGRLRPIIYDRLRHDLGHDPNVPGLEEGSEQNALLGRAVIGGMGFGTMATLFILPAVFTLVLGKSSIESPSLDPDDPQRAIGFSARAFVGRSRQSFAGSCSRRPRRKRLRRIEQKNQGRDAPNPQTRLEDVRRETLDDDSEARFPPAWRGSSINRSRRPGVLRVWLSQEVGKRRRPTGRRQIRQGQDRGPPHRHT